MALSREEIDDQDPQLADFLKEHGISAEVWWARPYGRWQTDNMTPIRLAYSGLGDIGDTIRKARQQPGYIITRHPPPDLDLDAIFPEIRPDHPVRTRPPTKHYHGDPKFTPPPRESCPNHEKRYCTHCVSPHQVYAARNMEDHIGTSKDEDDHHGVNSDLAHYHQHTAKYCFPKSGTIEKVKHFRSADGRWRPFHDHDSYQRVWRERHVQSKHGHNGADIDGEHQHWRLVKDLDQSLAKRIDMHPLAVPLFATADRVYLCIEGCIKADAVLTAILWAHARAAVLSVPSVTLWDTKDELRAVASRYLKGREVIIVPDADGTEKPEVMTQARLCQTALRELGIVARVAAPPLGAYQLNNKLKGVDDHLAARRTLDELEVLDRDPAPDIQGFVEDRTWFTWRRDRIDRATRVLRSLSMHAFNGRFRASLNAVARAMATNRKDVARGLRDLEEINAIHVEGDLAMRRKYWRGQEDWEDRPTIVIDEQLRAIEHPRRKLGKMPHRVTNASESVPIDSRENKHESRRR
jgi:hypothetical protein